MNAIRVSPRAWLRGLDGIAAFAAAASLAAGAPALAQERDLEERESYSYVRVLEGQATLASQGAGPGEAAEVNQPLLSGDRVQVGRGARIEIALADRNLLRVGSDSSLTLDRIAFSGDRGDRSTRLDLEQGEIVLMVGDDALGDQLPEVRANGVDVVVHRTGTYRIESWPGGATEVLVREGYAEVVTRSGSSVLRAGEMAMVYEGSEVEIFDASPAEALERWGDELERRAESASAEVQYVEPELAYQAAPLAGYGSWFSVGASRYWRPHVAAGWRPYWQGRWGWTPSGLTWISYEPWGWVPYHYGSWSDLPGYGWAWSPGYRYSPAWVYWNWSDAYVGWCPTGYYTSWYDPWYHGGYRWGHYGWAGGSWGHYRDWCFRPTQRICDRDWNRWHRGATDLERELGPRVPRGVLTTDTGGIPRRRFEEPGVADEIVRRARLNNTRDLPDVTDFVARKRDLPPDVAQAIQPGPRDRRRLGDEPVTADRRRTRTVTDPRPRGDDGSTAGSLPPRDRARPRTVPEPRDPRPRGGDEVAGDPPARDRERPRAVPNPRPRGDDDGAGDLPPGTRARRDIPPANGEGTGGASGPRRRPEVEVDAPRSDARERQGWRERTGDEPRARRDLPEPNARLPRPTIEPRRSPTGEPTPRPRTEQPPAGDSRQQWREREAGREPVQRVLDGVRRQDRTGVPGRAPSGSPQLDGRTRATPGPGYGTPDRRSATPMAPVTPRYVPPTSRGGERVSPRTPPTSGVDRSRPTVSPRSSPPSGSDRSRATVSPRSSPPSGSDRSRSTVSPRSGPSSSSSTTPRASGGSGRSSGGSGSKSSASSSSRGSGGSGSKSSTSSSGRGSGGSSSSSSSGRQRGNGSD